VASGLGMLAALEVDPAGRLVVVEADTGRVWRVDRFTGDRTLLASGEPGLDNLAIDGTGAVYVSNFVRGDVRRVDAGHGTLVPLGDDAPLSMPSSLAPGAGGGSLLVADVTSVARLDARGDVQRVGRIFVDAPDRSSVEDVQFMTTGAVEVEDAVYATDFMPLLAGRLVRIDAATGRREVVADGFAYPWTVRADGQGRLLVTDRAMGSLSEVDPGTGLVRPVATALSGPTGLAVDGPVAYVAETTAGLVAAVDLDTGVTTTVAVDLDAPEGVAVCGVNCLLVVEAATGRLLRVDPRSGARAVVAEGLPTAITGIGIPFFDLSADVMVQAGGDIVVSGTADGSLIELHRLGQ